MRNAPVNTIVRHLNQIVLDAEPLRESELSAHYRERIHRLMFNLEFYEECHPLIDAARPERKTKRRRKASARR